ncbi:tellurite resistance protein [Proteus mirabilis]|uniref:Tellurite resistance protein n=1 Tax=Proteus mirabilis TaxID=584 RepID=A0A379GBH0_PROMI|nr:tellurite resistance protein [Proteus mirabilis]
MVSTHIGFPTETVIVFVVLAIGAIFIDLFMHRADKPITLKNAVFWSIFWVVVAMAFAGFLYVHHGAEVASLFVTGYALEKVLSVDNLFVMMAISLGLRFLIVSVTAFCIGGSLVPLYSVRSLLLLVPAY